MGVSNEVVGADSGFFGCSLMWMGVIWLELAVFQKSIGNFTVRPDFRFKGRSRGMPAASDSSAVDIVWRHDCS